MYLYKRIFSFLLIVGISPAMTALADVYFQDDFEDGTWADKWVLVNDQLYDPVVTDQDAAGGTQYSLRLFGGASTNDYWHFMGLNTVFTPAQPTYVGYYTMLDNTRFRATNYCVIGDADVTSNAGVIFTWGRPDEANLRLYSNEDEYYVHPVTVGEWHLVEFHLDWEARTVDWLVDSQLVIAGVSFRSETSVDISTIHLYSIHDDEEPMLANSWYDEIMVGDGSLTEVQPATFELAQNYPNPFNPGTTIEFSIQEPGDVLLSVYDVSGSQVATLVDGPVAVGEHSVYFDASRLPSGVYFYTLTGGEARVTKKMVYVK